MNPGCFQAVNGDTFSRFAGSPVARTVVVTSQPKTLKHVCGIQASSRTRTRAGVNRHRRRPPRRSATPPSRSSTAVGHASTGSTLRARSPAAGARRAGRRRRTTRGRTTCSPKVQRYQGPCPIPGFEATRGFTSSTH